jgi:hypothetical protein
VKSFRVLRPFNEKAMERPAITLGGCVNVLTSRSLFQNGRRNSAIAALGLSALLLVSCGGDDEADPTEAPAATTAPQATEAPTEEASTPAAGDDATPVSGGVSTPVASAATPVPSGDDDASPVVSFNDDDATPVGSPEATPVT